MTKVNLRPLTFDLQLYSGDTYAVEIEPVGELDEPADLSDRVWSAQWRRNRSSADAVDLEVDATGAADGLVVVHFRSGATALFSESGVWDVSGADDDDQAITLATGSVRTLRRVTHE